MKMFKQFYPSEYADSAYAISYQSLKEGGIRGIIFDIDNTLVPHGAPADDRAIRLFAMLKEMKIRTCLLSNNRESRVKCFAKAVGCGYICGCGKPSRKGYRKAMERMGTDCSSTIFVGDQLFTDIWGANRTGIRSILVKPIQSREEIQIVLKRIPERIMLWIGGKDKEK